MEKKIFSPNGTIDQEALSRVAKDKKVNDFMADITKVYAQHGLMFVSVLRSSADTIKATLDIVEIPKDQLEEMNKEISKEVV